MSGRKLFGWIIWPVLIGASVGLWGVGWGWVVLLWVLAAAGWFGYITLATRLLAIRASAYLLLLERAKLVGSGLIDHDPILSKVSAAYTDGTPGGYFINYRPDRTRFWIGQGLMLTWCLNNRRGDMDWRSGVGSMPWSVDPVLGKGTAVQVLKIELAEALLGAGVSAEDAATEVNAAIGPPNLMRMGWGTTLTAGGERTAKNWWDQYQPARWEPTVTPPPSTR
jgi:hypothetical protein